MNQYMEARYLQEIESLRRDEEEQSKAAAAVLEVRRGSGSEDDSDYENEQIKCLEQKGGQNYFGSQSLLSQEIHATGGGLSQGLSQGTAAGVASVTEEEEDAVAGLSQVSMNTSVTFDSQRMVSHYGLLTQEEAPARTARMADISCTTINSSHGGFGTLLDAVSIFQSQELEQEEEKAKLFSDEAMKKDPIIVDSLNQRKNRGLPTGHEESQSSSLNAADSQSSSAKAASSPRKRKKLNTADDDSKNKKSKSTRTCSKNPNSRPSKKSNSSSIVARSSPENKAFDADEESSIFKRKKRNKDDPEQQKQQNLANRAADLAQRTINEPELAKRLLLSMALTRENPRSAPEILPGPGHVLPEGFFWAHYPPLEKGTFNAKLPSRCLILYHQSNFAYILYLISLEGQHG
jgi:hypothetical protein